MATIPLKASLFLKPENSVLTLEAVVDYFDVGTMNVVTIANGIQITGAQTKGDRAGSWTQDIINIESFQIGEALYTAESLVSTFSS